MESAEKKRITVDNDDFVQVGPTVYGWVCPKCGRALSPTTSVCPCWALKDAPNSWKTYTTEVTAD